MTPNPDIATPQWKIVLLASVVALFLGLRLWFDLAVSPMGDEAYYWMWGQHPSWSYFDHPPLNGWLQGAVATAAGWNNFTVRLTTWLSLAGTLWVLWLWSSLLAPGDRTGWFWHTAAIYLAIPVIGILGGVAFHDHLLVFFVIASLYAFHRFAEGWEAGAPRWRWLYFSALLLGLAVLSKYNGVFQGLGYALWILVRPKLRRLLLTPHLWLAGVLAIAVQAPVLYWNLSEGMASLRFHFTERAGLNWSAPRINRILEFIFVVPLVLSPVLSIAAFRLLRITPRTATEGRALGLSSAVFSLSLIAWAILAAYVTVYFHWPIAGYVALVPVAWRLVGGRFFLWLHLAFGLFVAAVFVLSYTVTPLRILGVGDPGAAANYGWPELAARVEALRSDHPGAFLGAARYTYAAQLGFQLHTADVAAFNPVRSQNDYWWDAPAHAGRDALIVADRSFGIDAARDRFGSLEKLETVEVADRLGRPVWRFEIWLGRDFRPQAP